VEGDIEACFDRIDHTTLMDRVRRRIKDRRVLALIKAFLKAGVLKQHGDLARSVTGTPQGGILSPLLANIALSALDEHFARAWQAMAPSASAITRASAARRPTGSSGTPMTSSSASPEAGVTPTRW
jgi:RNA-directed DNA polymerase